MLFEINTFPKTHCTAYPEFGLSHGDSIKLEAHTDVIAFNDLMFIWNSKGVSLHNGNVVCTPLT